MVQPSASAEPLLQVRGLRTWFDTQRGPARAVDGVSFDIHRGEAVGIVGESGCGKSVTAMSLLRLIPTPPGRIVDGEVLFEDQDLLQLDERSLRRVRGARVGMVFQEPMTSLNPVYTVGDQVIEAIQVHNPRLPWADARRRVVELLDKVGLPDARQRLSAYPHELSGGMKQRVMIAMALSCEPSLLVADEPTTALDVTIQAQILALLADLQREEDMSLLLITHDLGVIAETCDRVLVMYAGHIVETAPVGVLFDAPLHPYTRGLFASRPDLRRPRGEPLPTIPGVVPSAIDFPSGCRFRQRCARASGICAERPPLRAVEEDHEVACHMVDPSREGAQA